MTAFDFSRPEMARLLADVQAHLLAEHDLELGRFEAESLLQFMAGKLAALYYNRGLHDAQALLAEQIERFNDALYLLEKPVAL
ncbi:DUF2164 domain-containing protein [Allorhizobium sp. BGMRC 0089]|uniref:DUF2164 domain-containing protein n=1 Tax=Allorhizobium sonneratiae TaxID=2934936 RepID=UPI0020338ECC|nr:DUF2164 domain-containing protein [Allorhizobium sonneratiae]MCM2294244.1 DUF2164 domain-containing protein [Allorhizobium sonneratiae]